MSFLKGFNNLIFFAFTLILGVSLFIIVVDKVGVDKIVSIISSLKPKHFAILIFMHGLGYLVSAYRWKIILDAGGSSIPFTKIFSARMVGYSVNYLTPTGLVIGEPFKAMVLASENNMALGTAMVSIVVEGAIFLSTLLFVIIVGIFSFITFSAISSKIFFMLLAALGFSFAVFYLFYIKMIRSSAKEDNNGGFFTFLINVLQLNRLAFIENLKQKINKREIEVKNFFSLHRKTVIAAVLLSLVEIGITLFAFWLTISFLGYHIGFMVLLGIFSLMAISNILPLPGSLGGFELSQIFAFSFFGLGGEAVALAFTMITRSINLIYVLLGIIYLVYFEFKLVNEKIIKILPAIKEKIAKIF